MENCFKEDKNYSNVTIYFIFAIYTYNSQKLNRKENHPEGSTWKALFSFHYCHLKDFNEGALQKKGAISMNYNYFMLFAYVIITPWACGP